MGRFRTAIRRFGKAVRYAAGWPITDERWWSDEIGTPGRGTAGVSVTPASALTVGAVYRAVNLLAGDIAQLPLKVFRRVGENEKQPANDTPLAKVLREEPNAWQTSFEWREMMAGHVLLRGNAYSRIVSGRRGFVDQLVPLHPGRMTVNQLAGSGRLLYIYRDEAGTEHRWTQDEVFHVRGFSSDGITGLSPVTLARRTIGTAIASEQYAADAFGERPMVRGLLKHEDTVDEEAAKATAESFRTAFSSRDGLNRIPIMQGGLEWQSVGMSHEDAQFLETRQFEVTEVARWFGVPPHMIGDLSRATFSNIEHQGIDYVTHSLLPWLRRFEGRIKRDLILEDAMYAEFLVDGLQRGDITSRSRAQGLWLDKQVLTPNEVRAMEGLNPREGGDEVIVPQGAATRGTFTPEPPQDEPDDAGTDDAEAILRRREGVALGPGGNGHHA